MDETITKILGLKPVKPEDIEGDYLLRPRPDEPTEYQKALREYGEAVHALAQEGPPAVKTATLKWSKLEKPIRSTTHRVQVFFNEDRQVWCRLGDCQRADKDADEFREKLKNLGYVKEYGCYTTNAEIEFWIAWTPKPKS